MYFGNLLLIVRLSFGVPVSFLYCSYICIIPILVVLDFFS
ncbi:hypothetical protein HMPREF9074_09468 [Capnocytophaga sp. oral taxon 329 str. F0087]|nr:hypothetical protein HMPREF9074_09468 [Capnocytophaga sp. oral taxon 329 str. F0087]